MSTTGDVMSDVVAKDATKEAKDAAAKAALPRRAAFQAWLENGGAFVGVHAASDTEYKWPWYGKMIGGYFTGHPKIQPATLRPVVKDHPATKHLPAEWKRKDEWYNFRDLQADNVVLILLDEKTYEGGKNGDHHPIAWCKDVGKGRMFYTAGGHTKESYVEPEFLQHVNGGLLWTLKK
jgi:type 1 glutamine amidotransferase